MGFTGTRRGMTTKQKLDLQAVFISYLPEEFHHGMARGADTEAQTILGELSLPGYIRSIGHPGLGIPILELDCRNLPDVVLTPAPFLERNHHIVDAVDVLIAAPEGPERLRSGTWATVRYARKKSIPIIFLLR